MKSSITKRWVRGSLLFTLAVVLVAEGVFLFYTITGYYDNVEQVMRNHFSNINGQLTSTATTPEERKLRLFRAVEQFEAKSQFELMLVMANGTVATSSSGVTRAYAETPEDITEALKPGGTGSGRMVGTNEAGEKVMAMTVPTPYSSDAIVAMRLVTSLGLVDEAIYSIVMWSLILFAAIVLASVVSGLYFIRSIVYPLQKVEASASRIAEGDFDIRIDNDSKDEIGSLCVTINNMAQELGNTERMKNEFISSVSHELRTPLTSIKGWTDTVSQMDDCSDPNFRKGLNIIKGETERLYDMVEELLDFSRAQDGLKLEPELLDLAAEVDEAVMLAGQRAASLGVALMYEAPELPVAVMADKNRVRQAMVNVLDNAIKYSFTGGQIDIEILQDEADAFVVVNDEGQGISAEDLENVKIKFYKGKGAVRGSGIGLAMVDEIMAAHGGDVDITSELGRGTQVTLRFPLHIKTQNNH